MTRDNAMRRMIGRGAAAFILTMFLAAPVDSLAQPAPAPAPAAPAATPAPAEATPSPAAPKPAPRHRRASRTPTNRVEARITQLHAELKITPAQTAEWNAVAQVMREQAQEMEKLAQQRVANRATMSAVDDLKSYQAIADAHAEEMSKLVPAFQALYAKMSPAQQKNADAVFAHSRKPRPPARAHPSKSSSSSGSK